MRLLGIGDLLQQLLRAALDLVHQVVPRVSDPGAIEYVLAKAAQQHRVHVSDAQPDDKEGGAAADNLVADLARAQIDLVRMQEPLQLEERVEPFPELEKTTCPSRVSLRETSVAMLSCTLFSRLWEAGRRAAALARRPVFQGFPQHTSDEKHEMYVDMTSACQAPHAFCYGLLLLRAQGTRERRGR